MGARMNTTLMLIATGFLVYIGGYSVSAHAGNFFEKLQQKAEKLQEKLGKSANQAQGPNPQLLGTWEAQVPGNHWQINVAWNAKENRYEGHLSKQGVASQAVGFAMGELVWKATPSGQQIVEEQEYRTGANGVSSGYSWRKGAVYKISNEEFTSSTARFIRVKSLTVAAATTNSGGSENPGAAVTAQQPQQTAPNQKPSSADRGGANLNRAPDSSQLPTKSSAAPDVFGIKLGVTTVADARAVLMAMTPKMNMEVIKSLLRTQSDTGDLIDFPNTEYVGFLNAESQEGVQAVSGAYGKRRSMSITFAKPPSSTKAVYITANTLYSQSEATSLANMVSALSKKYGGDAYEHYPNPRAEQFLAWAWSADGRLIPLNDRHLCAQRGQASIALGDRIGSESADQKAINMLRAGCVAVVHVVLGLSNQTVTWLQVAAFDIYHFHESMAKASELVTQYQKKHDQQMRDAASQRKAPTL